MAVYDKKLSKMVYLAQRGESRYKDRLIRHMTDNGYMKQLNRYLHLNRLLSPDDVKQEFWLGVIKALPIAKPTVGNPIQFLTWKGLNRIRYVLKKRIGTGVFYQCNDCQYDGALRRSTDTMRCGRCASTNIETSEREVTGIELVLESRSGRRDNKEQMMIEEFTTRLSPQEMKVFTLIMEGTDRDEPNTNYQKNIAGILGVTQQCVNIYLKKIRAKWNEYQHEV